MTAAAAEPQPGGAVRGLPPHPGRAGTWRSSRSATRSASTPSSGPPAPRSRRAAACSSPRRPAPARPSSASSPSTSRCARAASASTRRRSRRCRTRSTSDLVARYGAGARRPAHRRQRGQRRRRRRRHDHRGAAQHAVRPRPRAAAARCAGLSHVVMDEVHYLADRARGAVWEEVIIHLPDDVALVLAVGDGEQRRGVRRLAGHRARRHRGRRRGAPAGPAVAARAGRHAAVRPVRRPGRAGRAQPASSSGWPATRSALRRRGGRARRPPAAPAPVVSRPGRPRRGSTARGCCPPSPSSSAGPAAQRPSSSACAPGCGSTRAEEAERVRAARRAAHPRPPARGPAGAGLLGVAGGPAARASPRTTPGCCRPSRRSSRSCSPAAWSRRSSPPRRSRSASTCRPARWCSRSSSSGTARRTPT